MDNRKHGKKKSEPVPVPKVTQHQPTQEFIEISDDSSDGSHESDSQVIPNDYVIEPPGGYLENELFNILAVFKMRFKAFEREYGNDESFAHVNESYDIYHNAIDDILSLFETNFMCSE